MKRSIVALVIATILVRIGRAETFTVLHAFDPLNTNEGYRPETALVTDGTVLYGTTTSQFDGGTFFRMNFDGSGFTTIFRLSSADFNWPNSLILNGTTLYGTTWQGNRTLFKIETNGSGFIILKAFGATEGSACPGLILQNGFLYGTTGNGGASRQGSIFRIALDGTSFTLLYSFTESDSSYHNYDGAWPLAGLLCANGVLFGTTSGGGAYGSGTIFKINPDGTAFSVIHNFGAISYANGTYAGTNLDGVDARGPLILQDGILYGTTSSAGAEGYGTVFRINTNGDGFTVLHHFASSGNGWPGNGPWAGLTMRGNTLYGTASRDGYGIGTVFKLRTDGTQFAVLHAFELPAATNQTGGLPHASLLLSGNTLYGTAAIDGPFGGGTVFSLDLPSPPAPLLSSVQQTNGTFSFSWNAEPGNSYQVQYSTDPTALNWINLGGVIVASNSSQSASDFIGSNSERFYRVVLLP